MRSRATKETTRKSTARSEQLAMLHEEALRRSEEHARQTTSAYVRGFFGQMGSIQQQHLERIRTLRALPTRR